MKEVRLLIEPYKTYAENPLQKFQRKHGINDFFARNSISRPRMV